LPVRRYSLLLAIVLLMASLAACGGKSATQPVDEKGASAQIAHISPSPTPLVTAGNTWAPTSSPTTRPTQTSTKTASPEATSTATSTASRTSTPLPSATPTQSPTLTPASTSAAAPQARLETGRWLQSIGDCAAARREFAEIAAGDSPPAAASEARYRMAQCYLRDEAPGEAATILSELLAAAPQSDPYYAPANFLLGEAQLRLGKWSEAEASYTAYLPSAPELKSLIWQRVGAARKGAGNLMGATQAYTTASQSSPDWINTVASRRALAGLLASQGDYRGAAAQYDLLRGDAKGNAWASEMQLLAGTALAQAGDQAEAQRRWQAAVDADLTTAFAHQAIVSLLDAKAPVDEYQRGVVDYHNGLYDLAIAAFERLRAKDPSGRQGGAWYYTGLSRLALGQPDLALAELGNLIAAFPDSPFWSDAWLAKARALVKAGKPAEAIKTYQEFAKLRPDAPQAEKALWQAAYLQSEAGQVQQAAETYLTLARRFPESADAWRAYQSAGLSYFQFRDWRQAGQIWMEMVGANLPAWTKPVAYYWLGRAQAAAGETEAAGGSWQKALESDPNSYYGLRAAEWIARSAGQATATPTDQPAPLPGSRDEEANELSAWLQSWAGQGQLALPPSVLTDPDWTRGAKLSMLGLRPQALAAWGRVQTRHAQNPWALAALALAFRDAGANRLSILSAEALVGLWGHGGMRAAPIALQRLAYPLPFAELIRAEAGKWGLDPRLLAAVIRQESHFEAGVASSAGAQGLMQVMPGTAKSIASQLGWQDFEPQQAYWPYVNVAFGAFYVQQWLKHFGNSLFAALAAYNGGPGNAAVWRGWAPDDDDLMVGLININETRVYVQTVWTQYEEYKRLYAQ
jgi:soluble lytic murein transglycosylase